MLNSSKPLGVGMLGHVDFGRATSASRERTDRAPYSVAIHRGDGPLVITLHEVFSPAQRTLPKCDADAATQEIYRRFIADAVASLREHMNTLAEESVPHPAQVFPRVQESRLPDFAAPLAKTLVTTPP
jgi:hypothetical protein